MDYEYSGSVELLKREIDKLHVQLAGLQHTLAGWRKDTPQRTVSPSHQEAAPLVALQEKRPRRDEARSLLESLPAMVYSVPLGDEDSPYYSPYTETLTGIAADEWMARPGLLAQLVHPDDRSTVVAELARVQAVGGFYSLEYRLMVRGDKIVWVRDQGSLVRDENEVPRALQGFIVEIGTSKDLEHDLRTSLAEKEIKLRACHQVVRNNLQILAGVLEQQSLRTTDPAAVVRDNQNRLCVLTYLHESLSRAPEPDRLDFVLYVDALTSHLYDSFGASTRRIARELDVQPIGIDFDNAVRLGLIINELVSNALQHAFPDERHGKIRVVVGLRDGDIMARVQDDGVGMAKSIELADVESPGLALVVRLVRQVGGTIERDTSSGTTFDIVVPAAK